MEKPLPKPIVWLLLIGCIFGLAGIISIFILGAYADETWSVEFVVVNGTTQGIEVSFDGAMTISVPAQSFAVSGYSKPIIDDVDRNEIGSPREAGPMRVLAEQNDTILLMETIETDHSLYLVNIGDRKVRAQRLQYGNQLGSLLSNDDPPYGHGIFGLLGGPMQYGGNLFWAFENPPESLSVREDDITKTRLGVHIDYAIAPISSFHKK